MKTLLPEEYIQVQKQKSKILHHSFDDEIIRKYDIRGIVDDSLNEIDAYFIGLSFAQTLLEQGGKSIAVGFDGRHSSRRLENSLVKGLFEGGLSVIRIGLGPTPMLYYSIFKLDVDAGIMVTGSHNGPQYNGFKFSLKNRPFFGADILGLAALCRKGVGLSENGSIEEVLIQPSYVLRLFRGFHIPKPLSVVWDPGNGASGEVIQDLTALLPGRHKIINGEIDGDFPNHHPDPTVPENLRDLQEIVVREGFDLGLAFDGDGDRLGAIDGKGNIIWADKLLTLFSEDILSRHPGATFIADVKTSQTYFDKIKSVGGNPIIWNTGHSLIKTKMLETGALLAGEMSGHIFFADSYYGFDDAQYSAIRLLNLLSSSPQTLSEMCDDLPQAYATPEIRIPCPENRKASIMKQVLEVSLKTDDHILSLDGVRSSSSSGWWLLRPSNTEPVLVARCEAKSKQALSLLVKNLEALLKDQGLKTILSVSV